MSNPIYHLKGTLYRTQDNLKDLVEIDEVFEDASPIVAREKAFSRYQSLIDVFLQSKDLEYQSHEQAEEKMTDFVDSYKKEYALGNPDLEIDVDFDKGLYIYFITDPNDTFTTKEGVVTYNKKHLIHYLDNQFDSYHGDVLTSLRSEYKYYKDNSYDIKDYKCDINTSVIFEDTPFVTILNTPLNFQKYFPE